MGLSDDERRRWLELEAQLASDRRLAILARRLRGTPSPKLIAAWAIGPVLGFALVLAGSASGSTTVLSLGVTVLAATLVLAGIGLIASGARDARRQSRLSDMSHSRRRP